MICRVVGHTVRRDGVKVLELYHPGTGDHHQWPVEEFTVRLGAMVDFRPVTVETSPLGDRRERAVACVDCRRDTFNYSARCDRCIAEFEHGWDHADDERY
jgi:hypothetical protein